MMTKSLLPPVNPAAAEIEPIPSSGEFAGSPPQGGNDFFSIISQTLDALSSPSVVQSANEQESAVPPENSPPNTLLFSSPASVDSTSESDDADSSPSPANNISGTGRPRQNITNVDDIDPSVASAMAVCLPQPAPPADPVSPAPASKGNSPATVGQDKTSAKESSESPTQSPGLPTVKSDAANLDVRPATAKMDAKATAVAPVPLPPDNSKGTAKLDSPPIAAAAPSQNQSQSAVLQQLTSVTDEANAAMAGDGIGSALDTQRMKFAAQKNEIAGRAVQKLPTSASSGDVSDDSTEKTAAKLDSSLSEHGRELFNPVPAIDLFSKFSGSAAQFPNTTDAHAIDNPATQQVERVARMVTQEVVMIKQSGANSLAVSLKLDPQTELFLQLTNHDGQIQAAIRFERGSVPGLENHWGQLQESLARQNVQLLPLAEKPSARNPSFHAPSDSSNSRQFNQSARDRQLPSRDLPAELPAAEKTAGTGPSRAGKNTNTSPKGWEFWA